MASNPDNYGSLGAADYKLPQGDFNPGQHINASPAAFGAGVAQAQEQQGQMEQDVGAKQQALQTQFAAQATEAKTNDDYANKYAPAAAALRNQYDQLQGQDKIAGYDGYIAGLQDLNHQFTSTQPSVYGQQLMGGLINRHISGEIDGAKRELVQSQIQFSNQAAADKVMADSGYAVQNYNNPELVSQVEASNNATIAMQHMDSGYDPNDPDHKLAIETAQKDATGKMAVGMIQRALQSGDATGANAIRAKYATVIPGYQQLAVDSTLHTENMRQTGVNGAEAIKNGQPLPPTVGAPPSVVQAAVVTAASSVGVDQNHALTVAYIESSMGRDVGKRGDIGQTGKGGDIPQQAANMAGELKKSENVATNALGRAPLFWEQYLCYQQGEGGGPAILKAAQSNPNLNAVEALKPLYKDPKDALSAIVNNGGNPSMSVTDFCSLIKKNYTAKAANALCEVPGSESVTEPNPVTGSSTQEQAGPPTLADAILKPHNETGSTVQPGATPRQILNNFDEKYPDMVSRAQAIPNLEVRAAVLKNINQQRETLSNSSSAYSSQLLNQAQKLAQDPHFTDVNQIPSDMVSSILDNHPETMKYMQTMADYNAAKGSGVNSKYAKEYGSKYYDLFKAIHAPEGDPNKITSITQLYSHMDENGELTPPGLEALSKEFSSDPQNKADNDVKEKGLAYIRKLITSGGMIGSMKLEDPKGEENFQHFLPMFNKAIDDGRAKGLSMGELMDPQNSNWVGKSAAALVRSQSQQAMDSFAKPQGGGKTLAQLYVEYTKETDPAKKELIRKQAEDLGFVAREEEKPAAPISQ